MRTVIQRVSYASVAVDGKIIGRIERGLLVLVGIVAADTAADGQWLAEKIAALRIFADDAGLMNRSVRDIGGGILAISQFTLIASTRKGTRPSFNDAARPEQARPLYELFLTQASAALGRPIERGEFGADMQVTLINDGPVTIVIDSISRE
jgi:D-aminoacyl-tRNA deacylase